MPTSAARRPALNIWRIHFAPETEVAYREWLRTNLRFSRTGLFLALGIAFGLAPLFQGELFNPDPLLVPMLSVISIVICLQQLLTAALTHSGTPRLQMLTQASQSVAVLSALSVALWQRLCSLDGAMEYPVGILGVIMIAVAYFGGFSWFRVAPLSLGFTAVAIIFEFTHSSVGHPPYIPIYMLCLLAGVATVGSYHQEILMRLIWQGWDKAQRTRSTLTETEDRFQTFMQHIPLLAWMKDADGRFVMLNKAFADNFRVPKDGWAGRTDRDFFPAEDAQRHHDTDQQVLASSKPMRYEVTMRDVRNGEPRHWAVQKFPVQDSAGHQFVAGIAENITERKKLERALGESESRFEAFIDGNPALSWMKDEAGRYLYVSAPYRRFLGINKDDWRGRTDFNFFPSDFAQRSREMELQVLNEGKPLETIGPATGADGTQRQWKLVRFVFNDSSGRHYIGGVANDVTQMKKPQPDTPDKA